MLVAAERCESTLVQPWRAASRSCSTCHVVKRSWDTGMSMVGQGVASFRESPLAVHGQAKRKRTGGEDAPAGGGAASDGSDEDGALQQAALD